MDGIGSPPDVSPARTPSAVSVKDYGSNGQTLGARAAGFWAISVRS